MFAPLLLLLLHALLALAQSQSNSTSILSTPSPSLSLSLTTGSATITIATTRSNTPTQVVTVVSGAVFNVTYTLTPSTTSSTAPSQTVSETPTPTPDPFVLATKVDPAFAVLGVILILTGLPSAFWGHKNRWTSFFLIGFYTLSLVCFVLILKFGILPAVNPPSRTLRGMFVLSCAVAGFAGGAIAIFFWKGARYGLGAWGGFAIALFIQCLHNGGLIRNIGYRWILYIGCGVVGFTLSTIPKIHYHVLLISTAFVGATSFMLGVDCFTTAGLKEFYVWNIGFPALFPKFVDNGIQFPVSQSMQIELGLMGAIALMGVAVQLRILKVLQRKMQEIAEESKKQDEEAELQAADRMNDVNEERDVWEKEHPTLAKHGRNDSNLSSTPLMKDRERSASPLVNSYLNDEGRMRNISGLSDFKVAPTSDEDLKRASRRNQTPGALPALDLGLAIQEDVPSTFIAKNIEATAADLEDYKRKESLLAEIQNIRRSIDVLKSETPVPSSSEQSRRPSITSRRTLSMDAHGVLQPAAHARPPRETDPRARVHSMELSSLTRDAKEPISRPSSVPLRDDWDAYIQERKLLQPPAGVTPHIAGTSGATHRAPVSPAVQEALELRKRRESALNMAASSDSSDDIPLARVVQHKPNPTPVTILPPRRAPGHIVAPVPQVAPPVRTRTFEELNERHREKIRDLQAPLTQAEKEHAELEAARQRWERSKALEREAVTRRQAEKVAALEKRQKTTSPDRERGQPPPREPRSGHRHSRSLSVDKLGNHGMSSSKRVSMLKVEDWQRYQQDAETGGGGSSSRRDSRPPGAEGVPFPNERARRKSRDFLS